MVLIESFNEFVSDFQEAQSLIYDHYDGIVHASEIDQNIVNEILQKREKIKQTIQKLEQIEKLTTQLDEVTYNNSSSNSNGMTGRDVQSIINKGDVNYNTRGSRTFVEISEGEYSTISSLVRGRIPLAATNTTYKILFDYFQKQKSPLSYPSLVSLRLKPGKVLENQLKMLRTLGILKLNTKNDITWL